MSHYSKLLLAIALGAALIGCNKQENADTTAPSDTTTTTEPAPADTTTTTTTTETAPSDTTTTEPVPADTTTTTTTTTTTAEPIGVAECDDFLNKYEACVAANVPADVQASFQQGMTQWRDSWLQLAQNESTKPSLAQACTQAREQAKTSMAQYNCADL